ncbi:MAG: hypothetical protein PWQ22_991 [Archaeoglobaceae archaeon]|nr:hypothetical protein [Archaeoglobaceae archaeon]
MVLGFVEDLTKFFENASLFVYPARAAAYPVATLEAMRAGVPVIVSTMTGTKEVVYEAEKRFKEEFGYYGGWKLVVEPHVESIAKSIEWYFSLSEDEKEFLSKVFREISERYSPEKCAEEFKRAWNSVIERINSKS